MLLRLSLQCFRQFRGMDGQTSSPHHIVECAGANHLRRLKQVVQLGVAAAGIQRPLVFLYLPDHPLGEVLATVRFLVPVAGCSVGLVHRLSQFRGVAGGFPLGALTNRCTTPQLVCNGGWSAAHLSGNGPYAKALLFEGLNGTPFYHTEMLSLLAFCSYCDIILVVHSDCLPC